MRKNPHEKSGVKDEESEYAGDNFMRVSGDTVNHAQSQLFAWEAGAKGLDVHALAEPTKLEALKREYVTKKTELKDEAKSKIFDKYGGEGHLKAPPRELIFSQTEDYVEYSRTGHVIKGQEANTTKSRYVEDEYPGNHSSVWGSYWDAGRWGYKCCHSFIKQSYCTGDAGKAAFASTNAVNSVEAVTAADAAAASEAAGGATGKATTQESGMVEANQQSTKREEKDDEVVDTSTSASSDEAAEDDGLNSAEGSKKRVKKKKKRARDDSSSSSSSSDSDDDEEKSNRTKKSKEQKRLEETVFLNEEESNRKKKAKKKAAKKKMMKKSSKKNQKKAGAKASEEDR